MAYEQPEIRSIASRSELEAVYDILGSVFPDGKSFFQQRLDYDSTYEWSTTWLALQEGAIASTVQLFPFISRIDDVGVNVGGIGSVATVPEYRGQGHCRQILHRLTQWMEQQQYDLSLLFASINPFYEKAGWDIVPETMYELKVADIIDNRSEKYEIALFDRSHREAVSQIYEQFNAGRSGTVIRSTNYWNDSQKWPKWNATSCLVAMRNGAVVAYGHITSIEEDGTVYVDELCYQNGEERAVISLFHALVGERHEATRLLINLPCDHALMDNLLAWGAVKQTLTYMMWKVIRFQPLLAKLTSVFESRLQDSQTYADKVLQLEWICVGQKAYFHYGNGQLAIEPVPREGIQYLSLSLAQADFLRLLLQGFGEFASKMQYSTVLEALFPKQNTAFYLMDRF